MPVAVSSRPSPPDSLQAHLYSSLLEGHTADVALRIRGSWEAVYKLHRVVLIQAGFFRSLFTAGFAESHRSFSHGHSGPNEIEIVFDDPNITRAAFEICISRLYGGGPPLHTDPSLVPSLSQPLTPSFPSRPPTTPLPTGHHPASPRFLLSLIATAVYLSLPSVASQALSTVLGTVGPRTVVRYLRFACGHGVGAPDDDEYPPEAAVGLEGLAHPVATSARTESPTDAGSPAVEISPLGDGEDGEELLVRALEEMDFAHRHGRGAGSPDGSASSLFDDEHDDAHATDADLKYDYGAVSTKVGEAAACWLARWGQDILQHEERACGPAGSPSIASSSSSAPSHSKRRATFSTDLGQSTATLVSTSMYATTAVPRIWSRGGLSAEWVCAVLSSDLLFVKGERERYELAKGVVELRRREGIDPEEEKTWTELFARGIYYSTMLLEDLMSLSGDVSPSTGKPFVPLSVLQAANWNNSLLRQQISARPCGNGSFSPSLSPPPPRDKELGIAVSTKDIGEAEEEDQLYFPVAIDASSRVGDITGLEAASMDQLFEVPAPPTDPKKAARAITSEATFFGLRPEHRTAHALHTETAGAPDARWSPHPPFRFGVEFWDVDRLREKQRLHSHTVWYAGSLWNVYVQVVRKKGVQLGVYLHRQSSIEALPPASASPPPPAPPMATPRLDRTLTRSTAFTPSALASASTPNVARPMTPRSPTPVSASPRSVFAAAPGTPAGAGAGLPAPLGISIPATAPPRAPAQPFRDSRTAVSAHFTIACQSATGAALTRFASAPDVFTVSQSWGWKSSSLRTEEYLDVKEGEEGAPGARKGREVSLRATVVLGVV